MATSLKLDDTMKARIQGLAAQRDLAWLMSVTDQAKRSGNPFTAYAHCLCKVE